jgi:hypothetical protein
MLFGDARKNVDAILGKLSYAEEKVGAGVR